MSASGGKGSTQRPADESKLSENWDKINWETPQGADCTCGYPFCDCEEKCKEKDHD